jgi:hypothetical protein
MLKFGGICVSPSLSFVTYNKKRHKNIQKHGGGDIFGYPKMSNTLTQKLLHTLHKFKSFHLKYPPPFLLHLLESVSTKLPDYC